MLPTQVPEVIRDLARWAVLTSLGAASACGAHHHDDAGQAVPPPQTSGSAAMPVGEAGSGAAPPSAPAIVQPPQWQSICEPELPQLLERVKLTNHADYAAFYRAYLGSRLPDMPPGVTLWQQSGTSCATASDKDACEEALASARKPGDNCPPNSRCHSYLVTTAGDEVSRTEERAAVVALIGVIDDRWKAVLLAAIDDYPLRCPGVSTMPLRGTETRSTESGYDLRTEWEVCSDGLYRQTLHVSTDGTITAEKAEKFFGSSCAVGRRPEGLHALRNEPARAALGAFLADAARLEAASVHAFERLARELGALDAPETLISAAQRSALDEIRHAHAMTALARRYGGEPGTFAIRDLRPRSAPEIALENAVEGCVRETYGALVAHHQAATARDPEIALTMRAIAADETRHAGLSWQIAAWLEPRLPAAERRALAAARAGALAQLFREVDCGLARADTLALGWPAPEIATQLITRLGTALAIA
jgi:hypothetical protein